MTYFCIGAAIVFFFIGDNPCQDRPTSPDVPALIRSLKGPDTGKRLNAVRALANVGKPAVPSLIELLEKAPAETQRYAVWALGQIGPDAKAAANLLGKLLESTDARLRKEAADALCNLGDASTPVLLEALESKSSEVRTLAMEALSSGVRQKGSFADPSLRSFKRLKSRTFQSRHIDIIVRRLKDDHVRVRGRALAILQKLGPRAKSAIPSIREILFDENAVVRGQAYFLLKSLKDDPKSVVLKIFRQTKSPVIASKASSLLARFSQGKERKALEGGLVRIVLEFKSSEARHHAANFLTWNAPKADVPIEKFAIIFLEGLQSKRLSIRDESLRALSALCVRSPRKEKVIALIKKSQPVIVGLLEDSDSLVQYNAARLLFGPLSPQDELLPLLGASLASPKYGLRRTALLGAKKYGIRAIPHLLAASKHKEILVRRDAVRGLFESVPALRSANKENPKTQELSRAVAKRLESAFRDSNTEMRLHAVEIGFRNALPFLGSKTLQPIIVKMAKQDSSQYVRRAAVRNLAAFGNQSVTLLCQLLKDDLAAIRMTASAALVQVDRNAQHCLPALVATATHDPDKFVRKSAIDAIASLGSNAKSALPALQKIQNDPDPLLRNAAAIAAKKIRAK